MESATRARSCDPSFRIAPCLLSSKPFKGDVFFVCVAFHTSEANPESP